MASNVNIGPANERVLQIVGGSLVFDTDGKSNIYLKDILLDRNRGIRIADKENSIEASAEAFPQVCSYEIASLSQAGGSKNLISVLSKVYADHEAREINDCGDFVVDVAKALGLDSIGGLAMKRRLMG